MEKKPSERFFVVKRLSKRKVKMLLLSTLSSHSTFFSLSFFSFFSDINSPLPFSSP